MRKDIVFAVGLAFAASAGLRAQVQEEKVAESNLLKYSRMAENAVCSDEEKKAVEQFRNYFSRHAYKEYSGGNWRKDYQADMRQLQADGTFADLKDSDAGKASGGNQADSGGSISVAYYRIWHIAEAFRHGMLSYGKDGETWRRCQQAIVHYGRLENRRPNDTRRFHASCFAIPTAAVNVYFCHLAQMEAVEKGEINDTLSVEACRMLKMMGLQAWTQPFRGDATDRNVVQAGRFQKHVWWVGGNALGYRSLLPVAFMMRSVPMVELLADVCQRCISTTSQVTYDTSFWTEGFTADGAGWGHGMQCLVWGYPIDGTQNALSMLGMLKGTPWEKKLSRENADALLNYFRGSNFYYYKGYNLPCVDRYSMRYSPAQGAIRYQGLLKQLLSDWRESFTEKELTEMERLYEETCLKQINMAGWNGYGGTRWFFNNDDLIKKNERYHVMVNMASVRCDGLESAHTFADAYNYYVADGGTLFQRRGNEYRKAFGAYDVTAYPGVTAREGMSRLRPVTNWRGYCSKYNFAAAATSGGGNAAAGFIFEKLNGSEKKNVNDKGNSVRRDSVLYGVKAYKSYFMIGDYLVVMGAGITNLTPHVPGRIRTSVEQVERTDSVYWYKGKGADWLVQKGGFAYSVFPEYSGRMHYACETRATDWEKMNPSNRGKEGLPAEVDVLSVWIDHGERPVNDEYGYAVYCGDGLPEREYPFEVLRNDTLVQAVRSADGRVTGAVFYDAGARLRKEGTALSVSAPCAVLIERGSGATTLSVTDALMDKDCRQIAVTWNGKRYVCPMPQGKECGKPAVISLPDE